jgi:hypothetical protein
MATLYEGTGTTPTLTAAQGVQFSRSDVISAHATALRVNDTGLPIYSCERWIQLDTETSIADELRFWVADLDLQEGWSIRYGVTDTFAQPSLARSTVAINAVPTGDPVTSNLPAVGTSGTFVSSWLVFQARYEGPAGSSLQLSPLTLEFRWDS